MSHLDPITRHLSRRRLFGVLGATAFAGVVLPAGAVGAAAAAGTAGAPERSDTVLRQVRAHAAAPHDVGALARITGPAAVIGIGEASHSAHQSFEFKTATFRSLTGAGVRTFALEVSWSSGQALDRWVAGGSGRLADIMDREFQGQYLFWNTAEYERLFTWMRARNAHGADLRVAGVDLGYPGPALFDRVVPVLARSGHGGSAALADQLRRLRPDPDVSVASWMAAQLSTDLSVRQQRARTAGAALAAAHRTQAGADVVQDARAIAQSFAAYAYDDSAFPERMRFRDRSMAENTLWWLTHQPGRIVLASSNTHVGYRSDDPASYPLTVGQVLHRELGRRYVAVGTTIGQGRINALPDPSSTQPRRYIVPPADADHVEHLLDGIGCDALLDLRTLSEPARRWFAQDRPVRNYGLFWSEESVRLPLGTTFDAIVHHRLVTPGRLR